jgi:hypothetical protein
MRGTGGFDADSLIEEAVLLSGGASDFGDPPVRPALDILLESYDEEARLDFQGRRRTRRVLLAQLMKRLRIQAELTARPEVRKIPIRRPLVVIGLPRTGTTVLHNLLALDPSHRAPRSWELLFPVELFDPNGRSVDLIKLAEEWVKDTYRTVPRMEMIHPIGADWPGECHLALQASLTHLVFETRNHIPTYARWLEAQDAGPTYRHYRLQLQLLLKRRSAERLLLKDPLHLWYLPELLDALPDACVVLLHRDPAVALASFCSLCAALTEHTTPNVDMAAIGEHWSRRAVQGVERMMRARQSIDPARIFDLRYQDLLDDPAGSVQRIYEYFGYRCSDKTVRKVHAWLAEHPQHKHGVHRYRLEQFGLDPKVVKPQFAEYVERFVTPRK